MPVMSRFFYVQPSEFWHLTLEEFGAFVDALEEMTSGSG